MPAREPERLRIGFVTEHHAVPTHGHVASTVRQMADVLTGLGHDVDDGGPDALREDIVPLLLPHYTAGTAWIVDHHWPRLIGHPIPPDQIEPVTAFLLEMGRGVTGGALLEARELAQRWTRRLLTWWDDHDVLVCPAVPVPPPRTGDEHDDQMLITWLAPFNLSGQPAIARCPAACTPACRSGCSWWPRTGAEDVLIRLAAQLEAETGWLDRHPPPLT